MEKIDEFLFGILSQASLDNPASNEAGKFLLKSEKVIGTFLKDKDRAELEFPPLNSYYRRIIHRLGRRYNLVHRVEATNIFNENSTLRKVFLTKPVVNDTENGKLSDGLPILNCSDWFPLSAEKVEKSDLIVLDARIREKEKNSSKKEDKADKLKLTEKPKIKILKRTTPTPSQPTSPQSTESTAVVSQMVETLSLEELEAKYQAARDRIFEGFTEEPVNVCDEPVKTLGPFESQSETESQPQLHSETESQLQLQSQSQPQPQLQSQSRSQSHSVSITQTQLNPDAVPFTLPLPVSASPSIEIAHIFCVTSPSNSLITREDLHQLIKSLAPQLVIIKTRQIPTNFAFLLTTTTTATDSGAFKFENTNLTITKWEPEFYLDN